MTHDCWGLDMSYMAHLPISKTFAYNKSCSSIFVRGAFFYLDQFRIQAPKGDIICEDRWPPESC